MNDTGSPPDGGARLGPPTVSVSGAIGSFAVQCVLERAAGAVPRAPPCGVVQAPVAGGWTSSASLDEAAPTMPATSALRLRAASRWRAASGHLAFTSS